MVFLADLRNEWPWNANREPHLDDKEIFTQMVLDPSNTWVVKLGVPMKGFAFIGIRFVPAEASPDESALVRLVRQDTGISDATVFGFPWDQALLTAGVWNSLGFPLTHTFCHVTPLEIIVKMDRPLMGKIELLAQKIDDILDGEVLLGLLHDRKQRLEWIQDRGGRLRYPDTSIQFDRVKIVPGLYRLLDKREPEWEDRETSWLGVDDDRILYDIPPYPAPQEN